MADEFNAMALPNAFVNQEQSTKSANANFLATAVQSAAEVEKADKARMLVRQQTAQEVETVFNAVDEIQSNVETIAGNPFSELFGLFKPAYNIKVQDARLKREGLKLTRIKQRSDMADQVHAQIVGSAERQLGLAETQATIAQRNLSNLSAEVNLRLQARALQSADRERAIAGMTDDQIDALVADPTKIPKNNADLRLGDLRAAQRDRATARLSAENLRLQMQTNQFNLNEKQIEANDKAVGRLLELMPSQNLVALGEQARKSGGSYVLEKPLAVAPGVILPAGVPISFDRIQQSIVDKSSKQKEYNRTIAERDAALANAEGNLVVSQQGLLNVQSQRTGLPATQLDLASFTPQEATEITSAYRLIEQANQTPDRDMANEMVVLAQEKMALAQKTANKAVIDATDKDLQPAMQEFLDTKMIQNPANANKVLATALVDPNTAGASGPLQSVMHGLSIEALKLKDEQSKGIRPPGFPEGFTLGTTKKLDDATFVQQTLANYQAANGGVPIQTIIAANASLQYAGQVMQLLAQAQPEVWEKFYNNGWASNIAVPSPTPGDPSRRVVSKEAILRELKREEMAMRQRGELKDGDPGLYDLFKAELFNPTLQKTFVQNNLQSADVTQAGLFKVATGNRQVQHFQEELTKFIGLYQMQTAALAENPEAFESTAADSFLTGASLAKKALTEAYNPRGFLIQDLNKLVNPFAEK